MMGIVLVSITGFAQPSKDFQTKIVGGVQAQEGEFPYIVSLQTSYTGHFCGGTLVKKNWVLTAAHCVDGTPIKSVAVGLLDQRQSFQAENLQAKRVIVHPQYHDRSGDFDFALIELNKDSRYEPISMNNSEIEIPDAGDALMATVAGWGATREGSYSSPSRLLKVDVPLVSHDVCNKNYKNKITNRMICAGYTQGGKDSCQGDSGGPLVMKDEAGQDILIGVVSWGEGCARPNFPGVYAKVSEALSWIEQTAR